MQGADIAALQEAVIEKGNSHYKCYLFAKDVTGADIAALQEVVIKAGNAFVCTTFAKDIPGADIAALQEAVRKVMLINVIY